MPVLSNPRQERFARLLAEDIEPALAYERAGFTPSKGSAIILARRPNIIDRVDEIRSSTQSNLKIEGDPDDATLDDDEETLENIEVTRVWLLRQLTDNVVKSKRAGQFSAANKAIEMLGTYMGDMFGKNPKSPVDPAAVAALKSPREAASALLALAEKMDQQEQEAVPVTPAKEEQKDVSGTKRARKNQEDDREA